MPVEWLSTVDPLRHQMIQCTIPFYCSSRKAVPPTDQSILDHVPHAYDDCVPASAIDAALASATLLLSPCFPFYKHATVSKVQLMYPHSKDGTHVPLGKSQFHLPSSLSCQSLIILQASSNDSCCDREVLVVAVRKLR